MVDKLTVNVQANTIKHIGFISDALMPPLNHEL